MPVTKAKPSQAQRVREKSEIDDLFSRIMTLYDPGPLPPLSLPMFQGAEIPVLLFPTLQVAQARVWRNLEGPHSEELKAAIEAVHLCGLARDQVCFLIGLCEALFRPLRAVDLALERLFPDFLFQLKYLQFFERLMGFCLKVSTRMHYLMPKQLGLSTSEPSPES